MNTKHYAYLRKINLNEIEESHEVSHILWNLRDRSKFKEENVPRLFFGIASVITAYVYLHFSLYEFYGRLGVIVLMATWVTIICIAGLLLDKYQKDTAWYEKELKYERSVRDIKWNNFHYLERKDIGV